MRSIVVPAIEEKLPEVIGFVEEELEKVACPLKFVMQITVCVEEMFVNVAHYAYGEPIGEAAVSLDYVDGQAVITLEDEGVPFDPLASTDPDITLSAEKRPIGGLGIYMVKKTMDEVSYEYRNKKNRFIMKKKISC